MHVCVHMVCADSDSRPPDLPRLSLPAGATVFFLADSLASPIDQIEARQCPPRDRLSGIERVADSCGELRKIDGFLLVDWFIAGSEIAKLLRYPTPFHVYRMLNTLLAELRRRLAATGVAGAEP